MTTERYHAGYATDSYSPSRLITGEKQVVLGTVTIPSGAGVVSQFSVLGFKTADGKAVLSDDGAADGSEVPKAILAYEVDATSAEVTAQAYFEGCFNPGLLVFGGTHDAASVKTGLEGRNIYLKTPA